MGNYTRRVKDIIIQMPYNRIFIANELKNTYLDDITEIAYYKALERLTKTEEIIHLTKGVYYRPIKNGQEILPIDESSIIEFYIQEKSGMLVGERLLEEKGMRKSSPAKAEVISNNLKEAKKHVGAVEITRTNILIDEKTVPVIETLEILQNYNKHSDMNRNRFLSYMKHFARNYSDETAQYVIENRKYKKSTIAFMERMLTWYGVDNSLRKYLSPLSEYKIPTIEELKVDAPDATKRRLNEYVVQLQALYKDYLNKVILYGSYARGDYDEDSDIDIMILLKISDMEIKNYRHQLSELTYNFNEKNDLDIKPIAKSNAEFEKWVQVYPFYANIKREGVELFGVA